MTTNQGKNIHKGLIDIIMILGLIGCSISSSVFEKSKEALRNGAKIEDVFSWGTLHCIVSIVFVCIILIHIGQHWHFHNTLITKKLYFKNKLITLTIITFLLTVVSFLLYSIGFTFNTLHFHSMIVHAFVFIVIIHFITKFKKMICLFKRSNTKD
jgi:hypothetical protein